MGLKSRTRVRLCLTIALGASIAGCHSAPRLVSGRLPQRGYLWQRHWTPAVEAAEKEGVVRLDGVILLGAEIEWENQQPRVRRAAIDWKALRAQGAGCALALRVAPFAGPVGRDDTALKVVGEVARSLLDDAKAHQLRVDELQLDYDCAQKNLAAYRLWLRQLRAVIHPVRFTVTTLPAWLDEPEFARLIREVDGWVLQVHSVPTSRLTMGKLCDPPSARRWVAQAARLHSPFSVALPTYRCTAGYGAEGKLAGVAMDSVQPAWPPGTRTLEYAADADEIAALVHEWQEARPPELRELIWYRLPVATDQRNWRWPTLRAVMAGRKPTRHFEIVRAGANPIDLAIRNAGETEDEAPPAIVATWRDGDLVASDALTGWELSREKERTVFRAATGSASRFPPESIHEIGWLRFSRTTTLDLQWQHENSALR